MKKILICFAASVLFVSNAFAGAGFYGALSTGNTDNNFGGYGSGYQTVGSSTRYSGGPFISGASFIKFGAFYEYNIKENKYLGIKVGYGGLGEISYEYALYDDTYNFAFELSSKASEIPVILYYKYNANEKFAFKAGGGAAYVNNKWTLDFNGQNYSEETTKLMPMVDAGIEWLFSRYVSLGINLSYVLNGKMEAPYDLRLTQSEEFLYRDLSGVRFMLSLNVYVLQ
ncbi:MAG: hypothetical protein FWF00_02845 [Endomicrobia bacterium]|nr:hypothetical protein [Endomicrobiia bacterium]MCL2506612.1 hypothetical protein [Endomicrobiia bacterium]